MRSKTPLVLMEQLVMVLVFGLAAALCMQAFVLSDRMSRKNESRDRAILEAQNAAEALKSGETAYFEDMLADKTDAGGYSILYNEDWQPVEADSEDAGDAAYELTASFKETDLEYMWSAEVQVSEADGDVLVTLPVAGQSGEVDVDG